MESMIHFSNITKQFPGNRALDQVDITIEKGEVHALLGENGAGKSTLLNIFHGIYTQYEGEIEFEGRPIRFKSANDAIEFGISKVHQEVNLVKELTVGQNIALGYEPKRGILIDFKAMYKTTDHILKRLGCGFKSQDRIDSLSTGEMQMIQIAKALFHNSKVISFDEPTSALSEREVVRLLEIIKDLKANGITILFITHRLDEVFKIADRASILRDGKYVCTLNVNEITKESLIVNMVGRNVSAFAVRHNPRCVTSTVALEVKGLRSTVFKDISFKVHKGEILSFAGLVGAKRTDVMRAIFGADPDIDGKIYINGEEVTIKNSKQALKYGIALIPENRKTQGFIKDFTNEQNIALASMDKFNIGFFIDEHKMKTNCEYYIEQMDLNPKDPKYYTSSLSGGNAQKVIIAKWLTTNPDIIIFDEPTKGIDVGAKAEIYRLMEEMASLGKAIIMVSSELPEVIGMSDRVIVMREGKMVGEISHDELSEERILHLAMEG
ncbi:ribose ABC transporter (ATP-binding protein) [Petrocella atlantisensis]|uniref:Ribose ABC transporter (ATP-binding protein) n=1 Tax=Petrocella atlantisensis TaxID=2173034 RepID=A0A3P7RZ11_9FIRM|nr:sugar ABC transporter ATP-binding protein [Petrocella atlantisensis]PKM53823.1 MAG: sugar ABC transporter ATP-binding protein [Firmicutes bacterium HGW-Firmicutes-5]VDN47792.1 ribose ABC transporter (ATP-binding protein) [Petrocella atlantisensis]